MRKFVWVLYVQFFFWTGALLGQTADEGISLALRTILESGWQDGVKGLTEEPLYYPEMVGKFYADRFFQPAWLQNGQLSCEGYELRYQVQQSRFDGLLPEDYHLNILNELFENAAEEDDEGASHEMAILDIMLTDAYMRLVTHLYFGKVDVEAVKSNWNIRRKTGPLNLDKRLEAALQAEGVRSSLQKLWPNYSLYPRMRNSLRKYYQQAKSISNWPKLSISQAIKPNEKHEIIPQIRERLIFWKDIEPYEAAEKELYDSVLLSGIFRLQKRYGLNTDGVIGQGTLDALNDSPEDLTQKVAVNLERLRWLPDTIIQRNFILVNIANFQMDFLRENGKDTLLTSTAIVGRAYRTTPIFNAEMSYLVFSPTWTIPPNILRNDVIPAVKKDVGYLVTEHMRLLTSSGQEVDPSTINWAQVNARDFPYIVRQAPGHHNALGLVKFMFPNRYNVYIHDTPDTALFYRDKRTLSSGCIRIQRAPDLARMLLSDQEEWTDEKIREAMHSGKEKTVILNEKVPVIIFYLTFWTDTSGTPHIRRDVYHRDEQVFKELSKPTKD